MGRVEVYFAGYIVESNISLVWKFSCKKNVLTEVGRQHEYEGASLSGYKLFHSEAVLPSRTYVAKEVRYPGISMVVISIPTHPTTA